MTLQVGITSTISPKSYVVKRPNGTLDGPYQINHDLLVTGPIGASPKGVQLDIKPQHSSNASANAHSGVVLNASGDWQQLGNIAKVNGKDTFVQDTTVNQLWGHGRGWIFYNDGRIAYERWFLEGGVPKFALDFVGFNWLGFSGAFLATCTTNANGTGTTALYKTTGLGGAVTELLASIDFQPTETAWIGGSSKTFTIPTGQYASCFVIDAHCTAQVRPRAIFN